MTIQLNRIMCGLEDYSSSSIGLLFGRSNLFFLVILSNIYP
jgi:hypothetical protein